MMSNDMLMSDSWLKSVSLAIDRIRKFLKPTRLVLAQTLSQRYGCRILMKMENEQPSGSFKIRGAINKCQEVLESKTKDSVTFVTASTGNHALGCCEAWRMMDCQGEIYVSGSISKTKEEKIRSKGYKVVKAGDDPGDSEAKARRLAEKTPGCIYISPYNHLEVMAGQATIGVEILEQADEAKEVIDAVIVSVGGGSLAGGLSKYFKAMGSTTDVIGVQPVKNCHMVRAVQAGYLIKPAPDFLQLTIADGSAGYVENESITFEPCHKYVDDWLAISEKDIAVATLELEEAESLRVEATAGMTLAALKRRLDKLKGRTVVLVICGGNFGTADWEKYKTMSQT